MGVKGRTSQILPGAESYFCCQHYRPVVQLVTSKNFYKLIIIKNGESASVSAGKGDLAYLGFRGGRRHPADRIMASIVQYHMDEIFRFEPPY